jgi:hypothetical protein
MRDLAKKYPFDDTYDKRLIGYLAQAESIRTRVFRYQYEQMRKAVLLNIGKKLCMAAINIFLPYVHSEKRKEAVAKFEDVIKPLLGLTAVNEEPADIREVRDGIDAAKDVPPADPAAPTPDEPKE